MCSYCHFVNCFKFVFLVLFSPSFVLFSCDLMTAYSVCLDSFYSFVCISITDFCFVVTMRFLYSSVSIDVYMYTHIFPCGSVCKESISNVWRPGFDPWVGKIPWRRERLPTPVFWPEEYHGLYSPWGSQKVRHGWATFTFTSLHTYVYVCVCVY